MSVFMAMMSLLALIGASNQTTRIFLAMYLAASVAFAALAVLA